MNATTAAPMPRPRIPNKPALTAPPSVVGAMIFFSTNSRIIAIVARVAEARRPRRLAFVVYSYFVRRKVGREIVFFVVVAKQKFKVFPG